MGTARTAFSRGLLALCLSLPCGVASAQDVTLTIESWRTGDLAIWNEKLIPIFEAENPGIKITFSPIASADYDTSLSSRFAERTAGDLIACRPFDRSLQLFDAGYLAPLSDLAGMANFSALAQMAWQTDGGKTPFCVPVASVIHGFIYNRDAFDELGLEPPATQADFFSVLDQFKADGSYVPMAMGLHDRWEAATLGYENIGPSFWKGEDGRQALISGTVVTLTYVGKDGVPIKCIVESQSFVQNARDKAGYIVPQKAAYSIVRKDGSSVALADLLDPPAIRAMMQARFNPGKRAGVAIVSIVRMPVAFNIFRK